MKNPLSLAHVTKTFPLPSGETVEAVCDVSFEIEPGEIFGLLGPNGAGKTTIISIISSLESASRGDVFVAGKSVKTDSLFTRKNMGVVPQEIVNHGYFNLEEILTFQSGYYGIWDNRERISYLLKRLGLDEHRKKSVKQLSGGMKRRLMIAKALVHSPKLLLLDEPTAGVDVELRSSLWSLVNELKDSGVAVLLTTHYLLEAEELCQRVGILHKGKLQYVGETQGIIRSLTKRSVEIHLRGPKRISSDYLVKENGNKFEFSIPYELCVGDLLAGLSIQASEIQDLRIREGSLEEAFLSVVNKEVVK